MSGSTADIGPPDTARIYAGYLWLQAAMGVLLWVGIATSSTIRGWFELDADMPAITDAFFLADMGVVAASAAGAWAIGHRRRWAVAAVAFAFGGVVYPTIYLIAWVSFAEGVGGVALAVMLVVSTLTGLVLYQTSRLERVVDEPSTRIDPLEREWPPPPEDHWSDHL